MVLRMFAYLFIKKSLLILSGFLIILLAAVVGCSNRQEEPVQPFRNISFDALGLDALIDNVYPGAALFDYDRDGDLDIYVTQADATSPHADFLIETKGGPNRLFRNEGNLGFVEVASEAGVEAANHNSTGVAACDFDNDGYQDLYVAGYGRIGDMLDYRSVDAVEGLREAVTDRLFFNNRDGTFRDVTAAALEEDANVRSAMSVACSDVNSDGWLDIFVSNRADQDFIRFDTAWHHGHYNVLYLNNGDGTFDDVTEKAGLRSGPIIMRDIRGNPITFLDPDTGLRIEGYDPTQVDAGGNNIGEPTGQTLSAVFFDHDDDGDPDLWVADDGDRLKIYRNDTIGNVPMFTSIGHATGLDKAGAWMGFALGDYDNDLDLDVFVTNIGYHPLTRGVPQSPGGDCAYAHQFEWGTCYHYMLRNDGPQDLPSDGVVGMFTDVAGDTSVEPDPFLPSQALDESVFDSSWEEVPSGLQAYDFGFGTAFFDYENDGDQDLYWLGAMAGRGQGPNGMLWPGPGRMLRGGGNGSFEDITVESRLLDVLGADFDRLEEVDMITSPADLGIGYEFHENGKGVAKGDINGDGYVDLVGTNSRGFLCGFITPEVLVDSSSPLCPQSNGALSILGGPLFVWINGGTDENWVTLRLIGRMAVDNTGSNADAIGARVFVTAKTDGSNVRKQIQELSGGSSFLSMNATELIFGIGSAETVEEVEIQWPSGRVQRLSGLEVNTVHEIIEIP